MAGNREEIRVDDDTGRRIYLMRIKNIFERTDRLLVSEKSSDYVLILPAVPVAYEQKAAEEFNLLLKRAAGIALPMDSDNNSAKYKYRIFLGNVNAIRDFDVLLSYEQAGSDGFYIKSLGDDLLIAGVDRGTLFGVYGFFARTLGYRYYAEGEWKIDKAQSVPFYHADVFEKPDIDARSFGYYDSYQLGFPNVEKNADRLRIGRNNYSDWIMAGHTYFALMPKAKYEKEHPNWYSPDGANLCLSAEGVVETFTENVIEKIKTTDGRYFMIGQEDNFTFCDCPKCKEAIEKYGGESAVMMRFSNKVARSVADWMKKNCPQRDVRLVTFAYNKTSPPPVTYDEKADVYRPISEEVIAEDNLSVMFIPFGTVHNYPYTHEKNRTQAQAFRGWSVCAKSIFVWDYCANFDFFAVEFNDYDAIGDNYKFFKKIGVDYLFDQGPYNTKTPCFDELKLFLHTNLAWDSELDSKLLTDEFLDAYYKEIAPQMRRYLDKMKERWNTISIVYGEDTRSGGMDSSYYLLPEFFPKDFLDDCMEIFTEARGVLERGRLDDWEKYLTLKRRLKQITISVRYLYIKIYGRYYGKELPVKIDGLRTDMNECGIVKINEGPSVDIC